MALDTATPIKKPRLSPAGRSPGHRPAGSPSRTSGRGTLTQMRRAWRAYLFLSPGLLIFSLFTVFALLFGFYLTFHEWDLINPDKPFIGLQNYVDMTQDAGFLKSIVNTFYFTGVSVPITMVIGFFLALMLNQAIRFKGVFRTLFFLPQVTPFVVVAIIWKWLYNGDYGLFNFYLLKLHLIREPLLWLADQHLAMPAVILMSIWSGVGFSMVIYLAGMQGIPQELHEAAKVDGAGSWSRLRHVTIPMTRRNRVVGASCGIVTCRSRDPRPAPSTLFLPVMGMIRSLHVFTPAFVMP